MPAKKKAQAVQVYRHPIPLTYSPALQDELCAWLAAGGTLKGWCRNEYEDERIAERVRAQVHQWVVANTHPSFTAAYWEARKAQCLTIADGLRETAEKAVDRDSAAAAKVKIEADVFLLGKFYPKVFGPKTFGLEGTEGEMTVRWKNENERDDTPALPTPASVKEEP